MCGITGYVGDKNVAEVLLSGLKRLEYRGYDSSGIALGGKTVQVVRSVGKIAQLEDKLSHTSLTPGSLGIGHTRWATHGAVLEKNTHPHRSGRVTLVHNGIIENASELRAKLEAHGVTFNSDTDTEVIAALINRYYSNDPVKAIQKAIAELKGSYALAILFDGLETVYATRCESPLVLGLGDREYFVTSDIGAIVNYTKMYCLLEKGDIVSIDKTGYKIVNGSHEVHPDILAANISDEMIDKQGYDHYMLKEIMEEPLLVSEMLDRYLEDTDKLPDIRAYDTIHIVGCGSAYYAGLVGRSLFEEAGFSVTADVASEYRYRTIRYDKKTLVILISQSGETADTIAAMRKANENGADTLALVNSETSTIARESTDCLLLNAGKEIAVATTKAYVLQVLILSLLVYKVQPTDSYKADAKKLPGMLKVLLERNDYYKTLADLVYQHNDAFFIGRKVDYAISMEASLKLKEISYIHSEAYQAGELKHGTISLISEGTPVFAIVTDDSIRDKTLSNLAEVIARGAMPVYVGTKDAEYGTKILVPSVDAKLQPLLAIAPLQLFAYYVALKRGADIDKPKNLAKSVTVE